MMSAKFEHVVSNLKRLEQDIELAAIQAIEATVRASADNARQTTLFRDQTGETRRTIHGVTQGATGYVRADGAAHYLENGTPPHIIKPKRSGVLAFEVNGETMFRRMVRHPGTAERPFMTRARDEGERVLAFASDFYVGEAIAKYEAR